MSCPCFIVPPHLLHAISESSQNPEEVRKAAAQSLVAHTEVRTARQEHIAHLTQPRGAKEGGGAVQTSPFIPEHLLKQLATSESVDEETRSRAKKDLCHLQEILGKMPAVQEALAARERARRESAGAISRAVYDARHSQSTFWLPGKEQRAEGEPAVEDEDVNEAYDNVGHVLKFYKEFFNWNSIDNKDMKVVSTVHFGDHFENAFWFPYKQQMVFGDGNKFLRNFTGCIDVIGHELTHAVTDYTSPLNYKGQSGALNEHVSDVFGIMVKQRVENETAETADWLIGEYCLLPGVKGVALRNMKNPGTAYDDPRFSKDPQVDNFSKYEVIEKDDGGVHIYSGIPNKAFFLVATAFKGFSWEKAGKIWWQTMICGKVPINCTFRQFADVTVECAEELFGEEAARTVRDAWTQVGVTRGI
ncbi:hypothetical protein THARTR1_01879 [Trichoderma harzianum]|uniref:Peptidase M4 C-terminal domain-containing protein n=1 Tax=Trichoderma harzianum TaxID=5544 RepID=A0A2K0UKQ7_TRIHA|nr:hypothetical protein THARTR1_01879 [Trichoderma harzianum]